MKWDDWANSFHFTMKSMAKSMDIILDTIGADHNIETYLELLKKHGTFVFTLKGCLPDFVIFGDGLPSAAYKIVSQPFKVRKLSKVM